MARQERLVHEGMRLPFVLLVACFAAWGIAANMTDPLVTVFSRIFSMSTLQASFVQFAYYGAYFLLALPAAFINRRWSYRTGMLTGLGCAFLGAVLFWPAAHAMTFVYFLVALFLLAGGLSILETSANPFVIAIGPEANATRRLNLAQAFNPVGTNIGVLLAATLILPQLDTSSATERAAMTPEALRAVQAGELQAVMTPYLGFAMLLAVLWVAIALTRMTARAETRTEAEAPFRFAETIGRLARNRHYVFGVAAQFFNVAAQTCIWTFTIAYAMSVTGGTEAQGGWYLQASLIVFLISRFVMVWLLGLVRPAQLLSLMALIGTGLCVFAALVPGLAGLWAVVALSACLSLMFPTIYGIALHGLGPDTKFGAAGLVMAILGGAILPLVQGALLDAAGAALSYLVPAACFLIVAAYGFFDLRQPVLRQPAPR